MRVIFQKIPPNEIGILPAAAICHLEAAIRRTPASTSCLDAILEIAAKGYGNLFVVKDGGTIIGALYLLIYDTPDGRVLSPVLVGGERMREWRQDFYDFTQSFARTENTVSIRFIARKGWGRMYPKSRIIGHIFEHAVDR